MSKHKFTVENMGNGQGGSGLWGRVLWPARVKSSQRILLWGMMGLVLLLVAGGCGKGDGAGKAGVHGPRPRGESRVETLSHDEWDLWFEAILPWTRDEYYGGCLKMHDISLNCRDCGSITARVQVSIDSSGAILSLSEVDSYVECMSRSEAVKEEVRKCMVESFKKAILPAPFRNRNMIVPIGQVMGC